MTGQICDCQENPPKNVSIWTMISFNQLWHTDMLIQSTKTITCTTIWILLKCENFVTFSNQRYLKWTESILNLCTIHWFQNWASFMKRCSATFNSCAKRVHTFFPSEPMWVINSLARTLKWCFHFALLLPLFPILLITYNGITLIVNIIH